MFQAKIWHWHTTRRCFGKVCPLGCSEKVCIFSPFLRLCRDGEGEERSHSTTITLCWYFLFFCLLHDEDRFVLYTLSSDASHTLKNYVSPRDQRLPAIMSSLASGLVTAELRLNTSLSIGRRWGSTSTSLQTLLRRDVRRFWMPSCLCETKPFFLHHRSCSSRATELSHPCTLVSGLRS